MSSEAMVDLERRGGSGGQRRLTVDLESCISLNFDSIMGGWTTHYSILDRCDLFCTNGYQLGSVEIAWVENNLMVVL